MKVISSKYLPVHPMRVVWSLIIVWLVLDRFSLVGGVLGGVFLTLGACLLTLAFIIWWKQEYVHPRDLED